MGSNTGPDYITMDSNSSYEKPEMIMVSTVFWTLFITTILGPIIVCATVIICKMSVQDMFQARGRYRHYGLRSLEWYGTTRLALCYLFMYRHRPLLMETIKISVELCMMISLLGITGETETLVLWCMLDIVAAFFTFNAIELTRSSDVPRAVSLAYQIYALYSLGLGFPLGFSFKLLWIAWKAGSVRFIYVLVPFYVGGVAAGACAVMYLLPTLFIRLYRKWTMSENYIFTNHLHRYSGYSLCMKLSVIALLCLHFGVWFVVFSNVHVCQGPEHELVYLAHEYTPDYSYPCFHNSQTWTICFLPVTAEMSFLNMALVWTVLARGMFWRFLPEMVTWWSITISLLSFFYSLDMTGSRMNMIRYAACVMLAISAATSLFCNLALLRRLSTAIRVAGSRVTLIGWNANQGQQISEEVQKAREEMLQRQKSEGSKKKALTGTLARQVKRRQLTNCCICWEEYETKPESANAAAGESNGVEGEEGQEEEEEMETPVLGVIKQCGHYFHFDCIWDWFERKATCPLCRNNVTLTEDGIQIITYCDISGANKRQSAYTTKSSRSSQVEIQNGGQSSEESLVQNGGSEELGDTVQSIDGRSVVTVSDEGHKDGASIQVENERNRKRSKRHRSSSYGHSEPPSVHSGRAYQKGKSHGGRKRPAIHRRDNSDGSNIARLSTGNGSNSSTSNVQHKDRRSRHNSRNSSQHMSRGSSRSRRSHRHSRGSNLGHYTPTNTARTIAVRTRRKCHICRRRFEGDPRDVVVGYLRDCGHYYHCLCLERFMSRYRYCPLCYEHDLAMGDIRDATQTNLDVFFSLLSDILMDVEDINNDAHIRY